MLSWIQVMFLTDVASQKKKREKKAQLLGCLVCTFKILLHCPKNVVRCTKTALMQIALLNAKALICYIVIID